MLTLTIQPFLIVNDTSQPVNKTLAPHVVALTIIVVSIFIFAPGVSLNRTKEVGIRNFFKTIYIANAIALIFYLFVIVPRSVSSCKVFSNLLRYDQINRALQFEEELFLNWSHVVYSRVVILGLGARMMYKYGIELPQLRGCKY